MKKILFTLVLTAFLFNCETPEQNKYNENEIIYVVEMDANEGKSEDDIAKFSQYYTDAIDNTEPNSLGWGFYNSGDKVILIERYLDENAIMEHGKNISEGGPLETHFDKFMEHFTINKIDVYGTSIPNIAKKPTFISFVNFIRYFFYYKIRNLNDILLLIISFSNKHI